MMSKSVLLLAFQLQPAFAGQNSPENLTEDHPWCSLPVSQRVRSHVDGAIKDILDKLPEKCPFHPQRDLLAQGNQQSSGQSVCLADYCDIFGVAQTVLKRRDRNLQAAAKRAEQIAKAKAKAKQTKYKGGFKVIKMETLLKQSLDKIKEEKRLKRLPNKKKPKPKKKGQVIALCRNGKKGVPKKVKSVLRDFGLRARHSMTFILNNEESARKLQEVKPFTFWGVPSFKNVYNLVHKKAVFVDKEAAVKKVVLSDNMLIEKHLGDLGVICTEDLAHVIHTGGKGFDEVMRRLAPVNMGDSKKVEGLVEKKHHDCGDLRGRINKVLEALMGE